MTYKRKKQKGKRELDFTGLPAKQIIHELPESGQICGCCGEKLHVCGHDVLRCELTVIPRQFKVTEHVQTAYSCRNCEKNEISVKIKKSKVPSPVILGSGVVSPSLLAQIINNKYSLCLPLLYRQEQELKRFEIEIPRQNMAN